jgi:hypothetical protein
MMSCALPFPGTIFCAVSHSFSLPFLHIHQLPFTDADPNILRIALQCSKVSYEVGEPEATENQPLLPALSSQQPSYSALSSNATEEEEGGTVALTNPPVQARSLRYGTDEEAGGTGAPTDPPDTENRPPVPQVPRVSDPPSQRRAARVVRTQVAALRRGTDRPENGPEWILVRRAVFLLGVAGAGVALIASLWPRLVELWHLEYPTFLVSCLILAPIGAFVAWTAGQYTIFGIRNDIRDASLESHGRFEEVEGRFDDVDRRFDDVEGGFDDVEGRFDQLQGRFDQLQGRVDQILEILRS